MRVRDRLPLEIVVRWGKQEELGAAPPTLALRSELRILDDHPRARNRQRRRLDRRHSPGYLYRVPVRS
jgi:hypothetical protein